MEKKIKRILVGLFTGALLIMPVNALEQRHPVLPPAIPCENCGSTKYPTTSCGGAIYVREPSPCSTHGTKVCSVTEVVGETVNTCVDCLNESYYEHICVEYHSLDSSSTIVCPYHKDQNN